jgi:hypothetical protein
MWTLGELVALVPSQLVQGDAGFLPELEQS